MPDQRPPRGGVSFECKLTRIQAFTRVEPDEPQLHWNLVGVLVDLDLDGRGVSAMFGTLIVGEGRVRCRATVQGVLTRDRPFPSEAAFKSFVRRYGIGMVEEMYDVARRAININTAMLDVDLEIPLAAPHCEIEFPRLDLRIVGQDTPAASDPTSVGG